MKILNILFGLLLTSFSFAQVANESQDVTPLLVGEQIPNTQLISVDGKSTTTTDLFNDKPSVVLFFRGSFCPYCVRHLSAVRKVSAYIKEKGFNLIAISPDAPKVGKENETKNNLDFSLYSDLKQELITKMGLAFKAPEGYKGILKKSSEGHNSNNVLPVPSVYIVDENGKVLFNYVSPDYKTRISSKLLKAVVDNVL